MDKRLETRTPVIFPSIFFFSSKGFFILPKLLPTKCEIGSRNVRIVIEARAIFQEKSFNARIQPAPKSSMPFPGISFFLAKFFKNQ